jgi:hypothetical protein
MVTLIVLTGGLLLVAVLRLAVRFLGVPGTFLGLAVAAALGSTVAGVCFLWPGYGPGELRGSILTAAGVVGLSVTAAAVWLGGGQNPTS